MGAPSIYDVIVAFVDHNMRGAKAVKRNGSSISYQGPILYSYRTPIARCYGDFILIDNAKYSITTSRHIQQLRWRIYLIPHFLVPLVSPSRGDNVENMHKANIKSLYELNADASDRAIRWRAHGNDVVVADYLRDEYERIARYVRVAKLKSRLPDIEKIIGDCIAERRRLRAIFNDPKAVARRERSAARRAARKALLNE